MMLLQHSNPAYRTAGRKREMCCSGPGVCNRSTLPSTNCGVPPSTLARSCR